MFAVQDMAIEAEALRELGQDPHENHGPKLAHCFWDRPPMSGGDILLWVYLSLVTQWML